MSKKIFELTALLAENLIPRRQMAFIKELAKDSEEVEALTDQLLEVTKQTRLAPNLRETDGQGKKAMVVLHYFAGSSDWWIVEVDPNEKTFFGWVSLNGGEPECGYIDVAELVWQNVEIDLYWRPKSVEEVLSVRS